jgi:hypothetical protein
LPLAASTTAYNAANQLTQWGTATLTYDANGNMLSDGPNSFAPGLDELLDAFS